jgi:hypothetical protein
MKGDPKDGGTDIEGSPPPNNVNVIHTLCFFTDYCPYYCFTTGSIRLWCRDPSVRSSFSFDRVTRVGSSTSGSFAAKSERTHATISFQCRNFVACSRGTSARRASKTSNAFFQDTCDIHHQQCWSDRYEMVRTPSSRSKRVYSSTHISRASAPSCSKVESQRVSSPTREVGSTLLRVSHKTARWARQLTQLALMMPAPFALPSS